MYVCHVVTPEGAKDYVTLVCPEDAFSRGLVSEAIVGVLLRPLEPQEPITPQVFAKNPAFVKFMHEVIARHGPDQSDCQAEAQRLGEGWVYIIDQRTPTPGGHVPPEDIVGAFEVKSGTVDRSTYHPNHKHVILSPHGFFQLGKGLQECLMQELATRDLRE
jgi:hypothetical protein